MPRRCTCALPLALAAAAVLCASRPAFVAGPRPAPHRCRAPAVARRINIFEGINFPSFETDLPSGESGWDGARSAREADGAEARVVECNIPLGVQFEERGKGDIYVKDVDPSSDAWGQGVRPGAQLTFVSATFGDEMWNTRGVGITQFMTVLRSRFGSTIKIALEKEDKDVLDDLLRSLKGAESEGRRVKSKEQLLAEFEEKELQLEGKSLWNPFR